MIMLPLTWWLRGWRVTEVSATIQDRQSEAVSSALDRIEHDFERLQSEMLEQAGSLAGSPRIVRSLRERARGGLSTSSEELVRYIASVSLLERGAVEIYDYTPRLIAWSGFSMPPDRALSSTRFLETYQTSISKDLDFREALVTWYPVRDGNRVVGAVRILRLVTFKAPIQNQYIRNISLDDTWRRATHLPVQVDLDPEEPAGERKYGQYRLLQGSDGTVLGRVYVEPPTPEQLIQTTRERFDHVLAFWTTLLLFWLVAGCWQWYRAGSGPKPDESVQRQKLRLTGRFLVVGAVWWLVRYLLIALDVPARWQQGKAPLSPLFDPTHLASTLGYGLLRSSGDLLITALFGLLFAFAFLDLAARFREKRRPSKLSFNKRGEADRPSWIGFNAILFLTFSAIIGLAALLAIVAQHVVLDSTFDFFSHGALIPERLVIIVFGTLLIITATVFFLDIGFVWIASHFLWRYRPINVSPSVFWLNTALMVSLPLVVCYGFLAFQQIVPWPITLVFLFAGLVIGLYSQWRKGSPLELFILRSILPAIFILAVLCYPMIYTGMAAQQRTQMLEAAASFAEGRDPRVLFAIEEVLQKAGNDPTVKALLVLSGEQSETTVLWDSLASAGIRGSLLSSLAAYDLSLTFLDNNGLPLGRYYDTVQGLDRASVNQIDAAEFVILRQMYAEGGSTGTMVERMTGHRQPDRFQYEGIVPILLEENTEQQGWVMVQATPRTLLRDGRTPFPRVLVPSGSYDDVYAHMSIAEFRDGAVVRSIGRDFGRYKMTEDIRQELNTQSELWRSEEVEERTYLTYYRRLDTVGRLGATMPMASSMGTSVIAVRLSSIGTFDHLYYLLRLTVAGLIIGLVLYLLGLFLRWRAGLLPATRVRYRDRVLNAFLTVGIFAVTAVGYVGLRVVTEESGRAVQSWLQQHLERVEETLALDVRGDEMPYHVLERTSVDSLAARVGLDLNVYRDERLAASSRRQLMRERLIDERLPIEAYKALYYDGFRFTYTREWVGSFVYTAGFQALPDEQGKPRYIVSVPTLPEQERIEEERARTLAYLFGALLLLIMVVLLTASLLADTLARPIARLRSGLQAVARGRFEEVLPVDSRDEIGELAQTFNEMQEQLADSRRRLAHQERQLAWREMARQVAHEIKNPLTPMKLSVQHLRRAYQSDGGEETDKSYRDRFSSLFDRITGTLIEQIDSLARIANEFHSFARMPTRILERLDLNAVVSEAVALMQEEEQVEIKYTLWDKPLVIEADREEIRRNFINLIKNAIQAVPADRERLIEVTTAKQHLRGHDWAYGTVKDNGTGVQLRIHDKIFEPNFSTKTRGAGLGLAIVKKSVEEMLGEIGFETEEGVGTTFWIRLPLVRG